MAALAHPAELEIVDLTLLGPTDLDALLAEEIQAWSERFAWDFRPSADLLRRFLQLRSLNGYALRASGHVVGYAYYVCEERKGLIGDFFLRREYGSPALEMQLLERVVQALQRTAGVRRIESQLMMLRTANGGTPLPDCAHASRHDRFYMEAESALFGGLHPIIPRFRVQFVPWAERYMEEMAHLLAASYRGHVDSEINDQYRTIPGARQFLHNIVRFPGCGRFSPNATVLALDAATGRVCGMCLASQVSEESGHITQVCVLPALRGVQLGYELLRRSAERLVSAGCLTLSLTVTCANEDAVRLYRAMGFRTEATFPALVWEGF